MADGVAITAGSGVTVATDDAGAVGHVQLVKLAISADGSATVLPATTANGLTVDVTRVSGTVTTKSAGTTATATSVASTITENTTLLAADAARVAVTIYNESTAVLYVLWAAGVESVTVYSRQVAAGGFVEVPPAFAAQRIAGHWAAANGAARITAAT